MKNRKEKDKVKLPVAVIVFSAVFVSFLLSFFLGQSGILRLQQLQSEYENLRLENYRISQENRRTKEEIRKLRHDPAAIEKIAREDLHMVSPHDLVLSVPSEESNTSP